MWQGDASGWMCEIEKEDCYMTQSTHTGNTRQLCCCWEADASLQQSECKHSLLHRWRRGNTGIDLMLEQKARQQRAKPEEPMMVALIPLQLTLIIITHLMHMKLSFSSTQVSGFSETVWPSVENSLCFNTLQREREREKKTGSTNEWECERACARERLF